MIIFYTVDKPKHALQALSSAISVRTYAGNFSETKIIISFVGEINNKFAKLYEKLGNVEIKTSKRFYPLHGWSNKLIASAAIGESTNDQCLSLDCDMAVVGNMSPYLTNDVFNSRIAGRYSMPRDYLLKFFDYFKINWPGDETDLMGNGQYGIFYPAIGVVYAPSNIMVDVFRLSVDFAKTILSKNMNKGIKYVGQSAVALAIHKNKIPVCPLPDEMAFHMGSMVKEPNLKKTCQPVIIHHSDNLNLEEHYKSKEMPYVKDQAKKVVNCLKEALKMAI